MKPNIQIKNEICIKPYKGYTYLICDDIHFTIQLNDHCIKKNFITDLASIPRVLWSFLSPAHSALINASVIHDWLYRYNSDYTRKFVDLIFYTLLRQNGVSKFRASAMYYAVRVFGRRYFNVNGFDTMDKK